jgi:hypothetical protein
LDGSAKQSRRLASPGKDNAGIKRTAGSGSERRVLDWWEAVGFRAYCC